MHVAMAAFLQRTCFVRSRFNMHCDVMCMIILLGSYCTCCSQMDSLWSHAGCVNVHPAPAPQSETKFKSSFHLFMIKMLYRENVKLYCTSWRANLRPDVLDFCSKIVFCAKTRTLLGHLEDGNFGVGFDQFCPHLHFYTTYVDNFQNAKKILAVSSTARPVSILNELHSNSPSWILTIILSTSVWFGFVFERRSSVG